MTTTRHQPLLQEIHAESKKYVKEVAAGGRGRGRGRGGGGEGRRVEGEGRGVGGGDKQKQRMQRIEVGGCEN